jgi:hypothetical protein
MFPLLVIFSYGTVLSVQYAFSDGLLVTHSDHQPVFPIPWLIMLNNVSIRSLEEMHKRGRGDKRFAQVAPGRYPDCQGAVRRSLLQ